MASSSIFDDIQMYLLNYNHLGDKRIDASYHVIRIVQSMGQLYIRLHDQLLRRNDMLRANTEPLAKTLGQSPHCESDPPSNISTATARSAEIF